MTITELQKLTDQKFDMIATDPKDGVTIMFAIPIPGADHLHYAENEHGSFIMDPIEDWMDAWDKYTADLLKKKAESTGTKRNRTRKQAKESGAITNMPEVIALPTLKPYQNAISTVANPAAHLQPVNPDLADNLRFKDGKLYFSGMDASQIDLVEFYDKRPRVVSDLDLPTLRALYSVILQDIKEGLENPDKIIAQVNDPQYLGHSVKLYIPDFLKMLGYKPNSSKKGISLAIAKILSYSRILGVMRENRGGREYNSHYPVMQLVGHDDKDNTIQFSSPYINKLIMTIMQASIQRDKQGNPKLKSNGEPYTLPSHSYLVKSSIAKEKNKRAVEIVCVVVTLIEQAGSNTPRIKAKTIIDRCPDLKNALDSATTSSDRGKVLKRAFSKAWELLREQTDLTKAYKNIKLPEVPPQASDLDITFEFPHEGKNKNKTKSE